MESILFITMKYRQPVNGHGDYEYGVWEWAVPIRLYLRGTFNLKANNEAIIKNTPPKRMALIALLPRRYLKIGPKVTFQYPWE